MNNSDGTGTCDWCGKRFAWQNVVIDDDFNEYCSRKCQMEAENAQRAKNVDDDTIAAQKKAARAAQEKYEREYAQREAQKREAAEKERARQEQFSNNLYAEKCQEIKKWNENVDRSIKEKLEQGKKNGIKIDGAYYSPDKTTLLACDSTIQKLVIPEGVVKIAEDACLDCTVLKEVKIPNTVEEIEGAAFRNCKSLASITIPGSVKKIGCQKLVYHVLKSNNTPIGKFYSFDEQVQTKGIFSGCTALVDVNLEDGVKCIGQNMFIAKNFKTIKIPNSVETIGDNAFQNCKNLETIIVPDSVKTVGAHAFDSCAALKSVKIPESLEAIGDAAFVNCKSLVNVNFPKKIGKIGKWVFEGCTSLTSVEIPDSWTAIGPSMFINCTSIKNVKIPKSVKEIGSYAFSGCSSLASAEFSDECTVIGESMFRNCTSLKTVNIPKSVKEIKNSAFNRCEALSCPIVIPGTCERIGAYAFKDCSSISSLELQKGIQTICGAAFMGCNSLTSVAIPACRALEAIQPEDRPDLKNNGSYFYGPFAECKGLKTASIAEGKELGGFALFKNCTALASVKLPSTLKKILPLMFYNCRSLCSIQIPAKVEEIGGEAFWGCRSLKSIKLPAALKEIKELAFWGTELKSLVIPPGVKKIDKQIWGANNPKLEAIALPAAIKQDDYLAMPKRRIYVYGGELSFKRKLLESIKNHNSNKIIKLRLKNIPGKFETIDIDSLMRKETKRNVLVAAVVIAVSAVVICFPAIKNQVNSKVAHDAAVQQQNENYYITLLSDDDLQELKDEIIEFKTKIEKGKITKKDLDNYGIKYGIPKTVSQTPVADNVDEIKKVIAGCPKLEKGTTALYSYEKRPSVFEEDEAKKNNQAFMPYIKLAILKITVNSRGKITAIEDGGGFGVQEIGY